VVSVSVSWGDTGISIGIAIFCCSWYRYRDIWLFVVSVSRYLAVRDIGVAIFGCSWYRYRDSLAFVVSVSR
jgi:hypothetical protein